MVMCTLRTDRVPRARERRCGRHMARSRFAVRFLAWGLSVAALAHTGHAGRAPDTKASAGDKDGHKTVGRVVSSSRNGVVRAVGFSAQSIVNAAAISRRSIVRAAGRTRSLVRRAAKPEGLGEVVGGPTTSRESKDEVVSKASLFWPVFAAWSYFLSLALTAPAMPAFCNSFMNEDDSTRVTPAGVSFKGSLESVDQLLTFFFEPLWGAVSDHAGRKPMQILACAGVALGWGTVALSHSKAVLLAGRAIDGVTSCMLPICQSAVKDVSTPSQLSTNIGTLHGAAVGTAFIFGGLGGGMLASSRSPREVFMVAATVAALSGILIAAFGQETLPLSRRRRTVAWKRANTIAALGRLVGSRRTFGASVALVFYWLGLNGLQVNLFNYAKARYDLPLSKVVALQAASGLALAISNAAGPRFLHGLIGDVGVIRLGMMAFSGALFGMASANTGQAFATAVLVGSCSTVCLPPLIGMVANSARAEDVGAVLTALDSVSTLDRLLTYKLMSMLFAWGLRNGMPGVHFLVGAACVLVGLVLFEGLVMLGPSAPNS